MTIVPTLLQPGLPQCIANQHKILATAFHAHAFWAYSYKITVSSQLRIQFYCFRYCSQGDSDTSRRAYGPHATQPPLPSEEVRRLCAEFKQSVRVSEADAIQIEIDTINQSHDMTGLWKSMRRTRLTASNFGTVCKRRQTTPVANLVKNLLYTNESKTASLRWGIENESVARQEYVKEMAHRGKPVITKPSGLVIYQEHNYLACSPDGWVEDIGIIGENYYGIVEFKCPYNTRDMTPIEACQTKNFFCTLEQGIPTLKCGHNYFFQVQGLMAITKTNWCDFVVWTTKGISVQRISFDREFWNAKMLPKLVSFYETAILPELAAPEYPNGRPIREPGTW